MGKKAKRPLIKFFYKEFNNNTSMKFWRKPCQEICNGFMLDDWMSAKLEGNIIKIIKELEKNPCDSMRILYSHDLKEYCERRKIGTSHGFEDLYNFNVRIKIRGRHENQRSSLQRAM